MPFVVDWDEIRKAFSFGHPDCKNSLQSHIVRVYDAGHDKSGVFYSAEWHGGYCVDFAEALPIARPPSNGEFAYYGLLRGSSDNTSTRLLQRPL
ncbi:hypothetical protein TNCV_5018731 [Trichonephila clavipes]|nr:hypothetical protein TNCV_5018731 [Trichonephila clavipes]